jgi:hypothetical protein
MKKFLGRLCAGVGGVVGTAGVALADPAGSIMDVSSLTPDTSMVGTLGLAISTGLLAIWGIRKVIKLVNRS